MHYRTVYEISSSNFWTNYVGALIAIILCGAIIGYAIILSRTERKKNLFNDSAGKVLSVEEALSKLSSKGFIVCVKEDLLIHRYLIAKYMAWPAAFLVFVITSFGFVSFLNHENLLSSYKRGECEQIEGTLDSVNTTRVKNGWLESFWVNGHKFAYSDNQLMVPGFQLLHMHGGPIREGLNVRIWYRTENHYTYKSDSIARLDIAESDNK